MRALLRGRRHRAAAISWCVLASAIGVPAAHAQQSVADSHGAESRAEEVFARPVTIQFDRISLTAAVRAIAKSAAIRVQYDNALLESVQQPITLHVSKVPLGIVFGRVLGGTNLRAVALSKDLVSIQPGDDSVAHGAGIVSGVVTDAKTKRPLVGVAVTLDDSSRTTRTNSDGRYRFTNVPAGVHQLKVRHIGYQVLSLPVTVGDGQSVPVFVALTESSTTLTEVVTTATGDRQRFEVGNAVGTIHADSVVKTALIRNMSDLLQARLPGVIVSNTDGAVGSPSKIRLRGVTSATLNNDPIVILDGVRLNAQSTVASLQTNVGSAQMTGQLAGPGVTRPLAPSRLDDIDPNTIESIDVLRGPSASSLYGTDAANGVIVIKTKRGHAGAWRANITGTAGQSTLPGDMPEMWWGWGHLNGGAAYSAVCNLAIGGQAAVGAGGCTQDSVTQFNPENDPLMRTFGTGTNRNVSGTLSGGSESLQQFISGSVTSNVGMAKMSEAEAHVIQRLWSSPAPSWMVRPNTQQKIDGSSRTTFNISPVMDVALTSSGGYGTVLNGGSGIGNYIGADRSDTLLYLPSESQRTKVTSTSKNGTLSATANYRPLAWLSLTGDGGGDYGLRTDESNLRAQDCSVTLQLLSTGATRCPSGRTVARGETFVTTANVNASLSFNPLSWVNLRTSMGEQYSHTNFSSMQVGNSSPMNCPLAFGSTLLTPTPVCLNSNAQMYAVNEGRDASATAGVYLEETITVFGVYYTLGVRHDVSSAFGSTVNKSPPNYPKFNFSYPLSEQSFFPKQSYVSSLRLRLAYGQSGKQASQAAVLNSYAVTQAAFNSSSTLSNVVLVSQLGNTGLRPERGAEWEGGFDISFLENERIHAEVTMARNFTRDQITSVTLAPSFGVSNLSQFYNLGNVDSRSLEVLLSARVFDTRLASWNVTVSGTKSSNKLVKAAPGLNVSGPLNTQFRAGYPLFGYWGVPVESYADANHDGFLEQNEVLFGTQEFMGAPYPKGDVIYANDLSLWNGTLQFNATIDHLIGQTTQLQVNNLNGGNFTPRAAVDRTAPLAQQAAYIQAILNNASYLGTSSTVRVNELSVTYRVPTAFARRLVHAQSLSVALKGRNVASWSSYAGKDPNVDTSGLFGDATIDSGTGTPQPRIWALSFNLGL